MHHRPASKVLLVVSRNAPGRLFSAVMSDFLPVSVLKAGGDSLRVEGEPDTGAAQPRHAVAGQAVPRKSMEWRSS